MPACCAWVGSGHVRHGDRRRGPRTRCRRATRSAGPLQWKELYDEVITSGLCTGCAGCVIACPHDVIGYEHAPGAYKPFHLEEELGLDDCIHGQKGCTSCTRACPRFRAWEPEADEHLFARVRQPDEPSGHLPGHPAHPGQRRHGPPDGPGRRARVGPAHLGARQGLHRRRPHLVPRGRGRGGHEQLEGDPRRGHHQGGGPGRRRHPLHVLGQHARPARGPRARASRSSPSSA